MARLTTVVLVFFACAFLMTAVIADIASAISPSLPGAGLNPSNPAAGPGGNTPTSDDSSAGSPTTVVSPTMPTTAPTSDTPVTPPPPPPSSTPIVTSATIPPTSQSSASQSSSAPSSSQPASSSSVPPSSSSSAPSKSSTIKYSYVASNFVYKSTINGNVVTVTSTSRAPPVPTHIAQGTNAKVNTTHVIIAITSIGGSVIVGAVGFAWIKLYKGRRAGWDDDELMGTSTYGTSAQADPFKSTLDQYHRS